MHRHTPRLTLAALAALALAACQDNAPTAPRPGASPLADKGGNGSNNGNQALIAGATSSGGLAPTAFPGNTSGDGTADCAKYGGAMAVKVDGNSDQTVAGYAFHVAGGTTLSFSRSSPGYAITAVLVKGGPAYDVYDYSSKNNGTTLGVTADGSLTSPHVGKDGKNVPDISHYVVCYVRNIHVLKRLVAVMTTSPNGGMTRDLSWSGGAVVIPKGETRWLQFEIKYEQAPGSRGALTENGPEVCGSLGGGFDCTSADFNTKRSPTDAGSGKFPVTGSGTKLITLDIKNNGCGDGTLTNKVMFDVPPLWTSASTSIRILGQCVQKSLINVYTSNGSGGMTPDRTYMDGKVTIPQGQTRWLEYEISYILGGNGAGALSDDVQAACTALNSSGAGFTCTTAGFEGHGGQRMTATGTGKVQIIIDITNDKACGDRNFINTAVLARTGGPTTTGASMPVMIWTPKCRS